MKSLSNSGTVSNTDTDIELLLIQVGKKQFALPLAEVKHIVPLPHDFPCFGPTAAEYYAFEGQPLRYISSWDQLGEDTVYAEFAELQPMLPLRRQDHIDWINTLESSLRDGSAFEKARDPHQCAFGKWYYDYHAKDRRLSVLLSGFEEPHARIHGLADVLIGMVNNGKRDEALAKLDEAKKTTLTNLLDLFDNTGQLLGALQRRIAIVLEHEENICALGADNVIDIVQADKRKLTWTEVDGTSVPRLAMLSDTHIVPFLQWRTLLETTSAPQVPQEAAGLQSV